MLRGKRFVLFLSRLHEKKGCDILVDVFADICEDISDLHLVVAGPDQNGTLNTLSTLSSEKGVENRVHFPGMLAGEAKWGAFYECDVFCLPSHQENFGIVVAEAMACQASVIITNKVNIWREVLSSGGGIVTSDDREGVLSASLEWFSKTDSEKNCMRANAKIGFNRMFDISVTGRELQKVLIDSVKKID